MTPARGYAWAAFAYAAVASALLLWPWRFSWPVEAHNGVHWLPGGGVEFQAPGLIRSAGPADALIESLAGGAGFAVELWLAAARADQRGPARIVGSSLDVDHRNFTLGQEGDALVVRLRTDRTNANGTPPLRVPQVFAAPALRHVVASYDLATLRVWVDGRLAAESLAPGGSLAPWEPHPLWLGNESTGTRPWLGRILRLALYARPLAGEAARRLYAAGPPAAGAAPPERAEDALVARYRFDAGAGARIADTSGRSPGVDLEIPSQFRVGERRLLTWRDRARSFDRVVNLLAFVPFGFLLERALAAGRQPRRAALLGAGIALAFPLAIEALQYGLAARSSSAVDVALNWASACIGMAWSRVRGLRRTAAR